MEMTKQQVAQKVRDRLVGVEPGGVTLHVVDEDVYKVDDWWRVPIRPSRWPKRMSDFYEDPALIVKTVEPLRYRGNEVILFHLLDPQEIKPKFREPVLLFDLEETARSLEVSPEYARNEYKHKMDAHIEALSSKARGSGMEYFLMDTGRPLDEGLREYLQVRKGRF